MPFLFQRTASLLLVSALAAAFAPGARALTRSDLVGDDPLVRIRLSNVSELVTAATNSPFGSLWRNPQFQTFLGNPDLLDWMIEEQTKSSGDERIARLQMDMVKMLTGEVVLGQVRDDASNTYLRAAARLSRDDYETSRELDRRIADMSEDRIILLRDEFQGVEIVHTVREADGETNHFWQTHIGTTLIGSDQREWVEQSVARLSDARLREPEDETPSLAVRVHGQALMDLMDQSHRASIQRRREAAGRPVSIPPVPLSEAMGLGDLGHIQLSLLLHEDRAECRSTIEIGRDRGGLLALLQAPPVDPAAPVVYRDDNLHEISRWNVNLHALWRALPGVLQVLAPGAEQMLDRYGASLGDIDVGRDLLAPLGAQTTTLGRLHEGRIETMRFWSLRNPGAMETTLGAVFAEGSRLRAQYGDKLEKTDFRGHALYTMPQGQGGDARNGIAISGNKLLMGDADMVRGALRAMDAGSARGNPFMQSDVYRMLADRVPANAFFYTITDWQRLLRDSASPETRGHLKRWQRMMIKNRGQQENQDNPFAHLNWEDMPGLPELAEYLGPMLMVGTDRGNTLGIAMTLLYPEDR